MIVIHCAATKASMDIGMKEINLWHRQRGFFNIPSGLAIGYHYVIRRDGTVETGRPVDQPGAHAKGYNSRSIGICLVGGLDKDGKPESNYTTEQWQSLRQLVIKLAKAYKVKQSRVIGHNEVAAKACPCFSVREWVKKHSAEFTKEGITA